MSRQLSLFDLPAAAGDPAWAGHWTEASAMAAWAALADEGWRVTQNDPAVRPNPTALWRQWVGVAVWPEPVGDLWPALVAEEGGGWTAHQKHPREPLPVRAVLALGPDAMVPDGGGPNPFRWTWGYWRVAPGALHGGASAWVRAARAALAADVTDRDAGGRDYYATVAEGTPVPGTWADQVAAYLRPQSEGFEDLPTALREVVQAAAAEHGAYAGIYARSLQYYAVRHWRAHALLRDWPAGFMEGAP